VPTWYTNVPFPGYSCWKVKIEELHSSCQEEKATSSAEAGTVWEHPGKNTL